MNQAAMADEQGKTLEGLQTAIRMETDGKAFYLKVSRESGNETGRKLLESLAAEEDIHRRLVGQPLEIRLLNLGLDMDQYGGDVVGVEFDDVRLTATAIPIPAPAALTLALLGLGALMLKRKRS